MSNELPGELKERRQFVVWNFRLKDNGKKTKEPFKLDGTHASTNKPTTWTDYDSASDAVMFGEADGLGFVFTADDDFVGIDLDDCYRVDDNGNKVLKSDARAIVDDIDSYTEVSPSGNGIHIICRADIADNLSFNKNGKEMYNQGRFFTMTGDIIEGRNSINERTEGVKKLYKSWRKTASVDFDNTKTYKFDKDAPITPLLSIGLTKDDIAALVEGVGVNKDKRSEHLYDIVKEMIKLGANNETIMTHCVTGEHYLGQVPLAPHRANGNVRRGRYWLYNQVLKKARAEVEEYAKSIIDEFEDEEDVMSDDELFGEGQFDDDDDGGKKFSSGQKDNVGNRLGFAKDYRRNAQIYLKEFKLCNYKDQYYRYNGKYWQDMSVKEIEGHMSRVLLPAQLSMSVTNHTITTIKRLCVQESLNRSKTVIALDNGIIDVRGWDKPGFTVPGLQPHSPKHHVFSVLNFKYDPEADCPTWRNFLDEVFQGDADSAKLLQQYAGYCMISDYRYQKMLLMVGKSRSGKSVITNILRELVGEGDYAATSMTSFAGEFGLGALRDAKLISISDAHRAPKGRLEQLKERLLNITGGDYMSVNRKGIEERSHQLPGRIVLSANVLPTFMDSSDALFNRYLFLAFKISFMGRENPNLFKQLKAEMPGICNWAIQGLISLGQSDRFIEPEHSRDLAAEVHEKQNPVKAFADQFVISKPDSYVSVEEVYNAHDRYCEERGIYKSPHRSVTKYILDMPNVQKKRMRVDGTRAYTFTGITLDFDKINDLIDDF